MKTVFEVYECNCCSSIENYFYIKKNLDKNDCLSGPCYNGGKCIDGHDSFICICERGFYGPTCAERKGYMQRNWHALDDIFFRRALKI